MINHLRTIMINERAISEDTLPAGEELIDPKFVKYEVPVIYRGLHRALIPSDDRDSKNFIAFQWFNLLHAPDFEKFVLVPDTRITYRRDQNTDNFPNKTSVLDFKTIYNRARTELSTLDRKDNSLFKRSGTYRGQMDELRNIWNNSSSNVDRLAAAVTALLYRLDDVRI